MDDKLLEIGTNPNLKLQLPWLQIRPKQEKRCPHIKKWGILTKAREDLQTGLTTTSRNLLLFKGFLRHETISVVPENPLETSPVAGHSDSLFRDFEKPSDLVKRPHNVSVGCPLHTEEHNLLLCTDASVKG